MFERYTEQARRTLFFARYEAFVSASAFIETEHILLGLFRDEQSAAMRALAGVSREAIRQEIESRTARRVRNSLPTSEDLPFSEETERVCHYAEQEAERLLHPSIGPEHLLLGLFREEGGLAATILREAGLRLAGVRDEIVQMSISAAKLPFKLPFGLTLHTGPARFLRVSSTQRDARQGHMVINTPERVTAEGLTLKELIAWAYRADTAHVLLSDAIDDRERYDARLDLPGPQSWPAIDRLIQDGLSQHFGILAAREMRSVDVFVLTAANGPSPGLRRHDEEGSGTFIGYSTVAFSEHAEPLLLEGPDWRNRLHSVGPIRVTATTVDGFARWLEDVVGHPVINETGLSGTYDIEVEGELQGFAELRQALLAQLGLVLTQAQREREMLVVRRKPH